MGLSGATVREYAAPRLVLDARALLGECPLWSVAEQALYWVTETGVIGKMLK